jgi:hypothetical protein
MDILHQELWYISKTIKIVSPFLSL